MLNTLAHYFDGSRWTAYPLPNVGLRPIWWRGRCSSSMPPRQSGSIDWLNAIQLLWAVAESSGLEAGRCPTETLTEVSLRSLCENVVQDANLEAEHASCWISGSREDTTLLAYPQLLRRAIDDVLRNAIRYTAAGSEILLNCNADEHRTNAVINVLDSGPGVPESMLAEIFLAFFPTAPGRESGSGGPAWAWRSQRRAYGFMTEAPAHRIAKMEACKSQSLCPRSAGETNRSRKVRQQTHAFKRGGIKAN